MAGFGKPFALDFGAIMAIGRARPEVDVAFLSETIPLVEMAVVSASLGDDVGGDDE